MKKLSLEQELKQLDIAASSLKTKDVLRNAEINNIQCIIHILIGDVTSHKGNVCDILIEKGKIEDRLDNLAMNPKFAGKHEIHRNQYNNERN